jgi:hypothetical protein
MRRHVHWLGVFVCLVLAVTTTRTSHARHGKDFDGLFEVKPAAGREEVKPMKPTWCGSVEPEKYEGDEEHKASMIERTLRSFRENINDNVNEATLGMIARLSCSYPDSDLIQKQTAYYRQSWINWVGTTEAEDRAALEVRMPDSGGQNAEWTKKSAVWKQLCDGLATKAADGSREFLQDKERALGLGCGGDYLPNEGTGGGDAAFWLDAPGKPISEIARATFVRGCLDNDDFSYARCGADGRRLDRKALDKEIEDLKLNALGKVRAVELWNLAKARADQRDAEIKKQGDAEAKVFIDAPEAAFVAWDKLYAENKKAFEEAYAVEDKLWAVPVSERQNKVQKIGCEELRKEWKGYATGKKPKTKEDVERVVADPVGGVLLNRLMACDAMEGQYVLAAAESFIAQRSYAGPRQAAYYAAFDAAVAAKTADASSKIAVPTRRLNPSPVAKLGDSVWGLKVRGLTGGPSDSPPTDDEKTRRSKEAKGVVAAVKKADGGYVLSFKKESWMEPVYKCVTVGIASFASDGTPIPDRDCKVTGEEKVEFTLNPRWVDPISGEGVAAGQIVQLWVGDTYDYKDPPLSVVVQISKPGKGKTGAVTERYLGIPLSK